MAAAGVGMLAPASPGAWGVLLDMLALLLLLLIGRAPAALQALQLRRSSIWLRLSKMRAAVRLMGAAVARGSRDGTRWDGTRWRFAQASRIISAIGQTRAYQCKRNF